MSTAAVVPALVMPYETFMNDLAKSIQVYGTAIGA